MIQLVTGDILTDSSECLVNPVNCLGVSGAGLALQFKQKYPAAYREYRAYAHSGKLEPGHVFWCKVGEQRIAHLATKDHFKYKSKPIWIKNGLKRLYEQCEAMNIQSIALPLVGTGLGGLNKEFVIDMIVEIFMCNPKRRVNIYVN